MKRSDGQPQLLVYDWSKVPDKVRNDPKYGKHVYDMKNEPKGVAISQVWDDVVSLGTANNSKERVGYPTQKPLKLLERIIAASSNEGDVVMDPFAGCATACVAAEKLGRQWIGIDLSQKAAELVAMRLQRHDDTRHVKILHRADIPKRTDVGNLPHYSVHKNSLYGQQEGICTGCGGHFPIGLFDVDHIISRKHGGTDHVENLQLLCRACNVRKGAGSMSQLTAKLLAERERIVRI